MKESALQRKIQKYLKETLPDAVVWKNHGNQYSVIGLPDIMCSYKGKLICFEVKIAGNKATKLQEVTLEKLKKSGAIVGIAYSVEDVESTLRKNKLIGGNKRMRINKKVYDYIDYELINYKYYDEMINKIRKDIIESSPNPPDGLPKGNRITDPTFDKVVKLTTPMTMYRIEHNKHCIERALEKLDIYHKEFFDKNYKENNGNNKIKVCYELAISERTYYRMRNKIVEYVGKEMGLI